MAELRTPKSSKDFIDITLSNTPFPQATSTIERKPKEHQQHQRQSADLAKKQGRNIYDRTNLEMTRNSLQSANSSLGILAVDNLEDVLSTTNLFRNNSKLSQSIAETYMNQKTESAKKSETFKVPDLPSSKMSAATMGKLQMQRTLAMKALERADERHNSLGGSNTPVLSVPSYLLKPSPLQLTSESVGLPSSSDFSISFNDTGASNVQPNTDMDDIPPNQPILFEEKDFSGRSSLASNSNIFIRDAQIEKLAADIDNIQQEFSRFSMQGYNALKNTESDRFSFKSNNTNESFTPAELANEKLLADEESWMRERGLPVRTTDISLTSGESPRSLTLSEQSIGSFFQKKSGRISEIITDDPKFSTEGGSETTNELFTLTAKSEEETRNVTDSDSSSLSARLMSLTAIARTLENDGSPGKIVDMMLKNNGKGSKQYTKQDIQQEMSRYFEQRRNDKSLQLNQSVQDDSRIMKDTSNMQSTLPLVSPKQNNFRMKYHTSTLSDLRPSDVHEINKENITMKSDSSDQNRSIEDSFFVRSPRSGLTESPSRTMSELDLSAVNECDVSNDMDNLDSWIQVDCPECRVCTQVPSVMRINFKSQSNRWVLVKVSFKDLRIKDGRRIASTNGILSLQIPVSPILVEPDNTIPLEIDITTLIASKIDLNLELQLIDMVTQSTRNITHRIVLVSENPKISIHNLQDDCINFNLIGEECYKECVVEIVNDGLIKVPVILVIEQKDLVYYFSTGHKTDCKTKLSLKINPKETRKIVIAMVGLQLSTIGEKGMFEFVGKMLVNIGDRKSFRLLKEIEIIGKVGVVKLQIGNSVGPLIIRSHESQQLPIRNNGFVPLHFDVTILDEVLEESDQYFCVKPKAIDLLPGEKTELQILFAHNKPIERTLQLREPNGIIFNYALQGDSGENMPLETKTKQRPKSPLSWCFSQQLSPPPAATSSRNTSRSSFKSKSPNYLTTRSSSVSTNRSTNTSMVSATPSSPRSASASGIRSTSSEPSRPSSTASSHEEKLSLDATKIELVWGCIRIGKTSVSDFVIRNRSSKRIKLTATITGSAFKFHKDHSENVTTMNFMLHGNESRSLTIVFSPSHVGAAAGKVTFTPPTGSLRKVVHLYGYGGHVKVDVIGVARDASGQMWLSLGTLENTKKREMHFIVKNVGVVSAFACCKTIFKDLNPFEESKVSISPMSVILQPGESRKIFVSYSPRTVDLKKLFQTKEVSQIALLNVITGAEPTRFRIRGLLNKLKFNGAQERMCEYFDGILNIEYPDEQMPPDVLLCKETTGAVRELCQELNTRELAITVERNLEQTYLASEDDETCMFQSLCMDQSTVFESTVMSNPPGGRRKSFGSCHIEPEMLWFATPSKTHSKFMIISQHSRPMHFQVVCKPENLLQVSPIEGIVPPNGSTTINTALISEPQRHLPLATISIYVENEVLTIPVKIETSFNRR